MNYLTIRGLFDQILGPLGIQQHSRNHFPDFLLVTAHDGLIGVNVTAQDPSHNAVDFGFVHATSITTMPPESKFNRKSIGSYGKDLHAQLTTSDAKAKSNY